MSPSDNNNYNPPSLDVLPPQFKFQERTAYRKDDPYFYRDEPASPYRGLRDEVITLWKTVLHPNSDISQMARNNSDEVGNWRVCVCELGILCWLDERSLLWRFCTEVSKLVLLSTFSQTSHEMGERCEWRKEIVEGIDMPDENWEELWPSK